MISMMIITYTHRKVSIKFLAERGTSERIVVLEFLKYSRGTKGQAHRALASIPPLHNACDGERTVFHLCTKVRTVKASWHHFRIKHFSGRAYAKDCM